MNQSFISNSSSPGPPCHTLWSLWLAVSAKGKDEGLGQSIRAVQKIWPIRVQLFLDDLVGLVCHLPGGTSEWRGLLGVRQLYLEGKGTKVWALQAQSWKPQSWRSCTWVITWRIRQSILFSFRSRRTVGLKSEGEKLRPNLSKGNRVAANAIWSSGTRSKNTIQPGVHAQASFV